MEARLINYEQSKRFIDLTNLEALSYKLGVNNLSDITEDEWTIISSGSINLPYSDQDWEYFESKD
jgi:hypothetical protein